VSSFFFKKILVLKINNSIFKNRQKQSNLKNRKIENDIMVSELNFNEFNYAL